MPPFFFALANLRLCSLICSARCSASACFFAFFLAKNSFFLRNVSSSKEKLVRFPAFFFAAFISAFRFACAAVASFFLFILSALTFARAASCSAFNDIEVPPFAIASVLRRVISTFRFACAAIASCFFLLLSALTFARAASCFAFNDIDVPPFAIASFLAADNSSFKRLCSDKLSLRARCRFPANLFRSANCVDERPLTSLPVVFRSAAFNSRFSLRILACCAFFLASFSSRKDFLRNSTMPDKHLTSQRLLM